MSAVAAQTRRLLLSGLAAGVTATAVSIPAFLIFPFIAKLLFMVLRPGPGTGAVLEALFGFALPVVGAWAGLKARHAFRPFAVAHPENALVGLVWGLFLGLIFINPDPGGGMVGVLALGAACSTLTALVPVRFVVPGLFFSPLTVMVIHALGRALQLFQ